MLKTIAIISYGSMIALALLGGIAFAPAPALAGCCVCQGATQPSMRTCTTSDDCTPAACGTMTPGTCDANIVCPAGDASGTGTPSTGGKPAAGGLENPLAGVCNGAEGQKCVQLVIGNVIKAALGIVGSIALLMITFGGFLWLTSMGNSERVEKGKNTIIWASLGLALIFGAYALTSYIIGVVNK